jgi:fluoroacetyl-CoA thioesterase
MLHPETTLEILYLVGEQDLASHIALSPDEDFPPVFATSRLIALMELAAARLLQPVLQEGQLSVGVGVDVRHLAATPVDAEVRVVAIYEGLEGKLHRFRLEAFDAGGKIGEGFHTRAVVATERLVAGALARVEAGQTGA